MEKIIDRILYSGPLRELNFYQVNDSFFELVEKGFWIIDAGVELVFPSGIVSAAWDSNLECYVLKNDTVKTIYNQDNLIQLETEQMKALKKYLGQSVIRTAYKSLDFDVLLDYTMRTEKEKRFVEMILEFQDGDQLQIAFVDYVLEENRAPQDFSYDLSTDLLVSTKKMVEIKEIA